MPYAFPSDYEIFKSPFRPSYPSQFESPVLGSWFSHPLGGRCSFGDNVGENGCSWQRSPLSHSVYVDELKSSGASFGFEAVLVDGSYRIKQTSSTTSKKNIEIARKAFDALSVPPCGHV